MKTIVVPTDFSEVATKALGVAKSIAKKTNAKLHIANFYTVPVVDYSYPEISMPGEILEEMRKASKQGIRIIADELEEEGITVETTFGMGMATDEIVELARKADADLIIMGTTGASGIMNTLIGSNAAHVMQRVEMPIMLVPYAYDGREIRNIVYADSLREDDTSVIGKLFVFAEAIGAVDVSLLNINTSGHYEAIDTDLVYRLNKTFGEQRVKLNFVDADNIKHGIDKYLELHNIDLVVMSTHKKTLLQRIFTPSNTRMMALHSKVPLMVYHKPD
jgi:nucleotide-binding universal stress UspA family protein